jgi:hypothetical protein
MIYPLYWVVLYGVADVKIFLGKKDSGNKPQAEESPFRQYFASTRTDKMKLTTWNPNSKENISRHEVWKQVQVGWRKHLKCFLKYKIHPKEISARWSTRNDGEVKVLRLPLWSSGQSSWLQIQRYLVRFPTLPDFLRSSGSGTGSSTSWVQSRN